MGELPTFLLGLLKVAATINTTDRGRGCCILDTGYNKCRPSDFTMDPHTYVVKSLVSPLALC